MTAITVVIPAHNEENVIESALRALRDAPAGAVDTVVVANGCTDDTVARARAADSRVQVIDLPDASKVGALNAGLTRAIVYPLAVVDADVAVSGHALVALADRLSGSDIALVGSPTMRVVPSRSWWVRQHYRIWALTDYRSSGQIGSGVYMLTERGRARFGAFPDVIADDLFVQQLFAPHERLTPHDLCFDVHAPATLRSLIRRNGRIAAGNRQHSALYPDRAPATTGAGARALLRRVWRRPGLWVGFVVYAGVYVTAHRRGRAALQERSTIDWQRDETTRAAVA